METKIGHQIQKLRKSKNMSQEKLAEKLGVSRHSISNWEREVSNPDLKTILEITKLFNVSLNQRAFLEKRIDWLLDLSGF